METKEKVIHRGGCMCCPRTEDILALDTVLYNGFGGYCVKKDGETVYWADSDLEWEQNHKLIKWEKKARKEPDAKWTVELDLPLRSGKWERQGKDRWVLIETGLGFA